MESVKDVLEATASASPVVRVWSPPAAFDEYRVVHLLGRGAMGQVYLAEDTLLDRMVAVKFIATRVPDEDDRRERFRVEARAIARLQHPNVVTVHRVGEVEGQPYFVSEYVRGERLDELAMPVPWPRLLTIAIDLARGLAAAHRQGVLHRDLKPANVIVASDGATKLLDFGLAKMIEASSAGDALGRPSVEEQGQPAEDWHSVADGSPPVWSPARGAVIGTPLYLAPEIWCQEPATRKSDVYSLGILLYELSTGRLPHAGKSLAELRTAVTTAPLPPLRKVADHIDARFAAVVDHCVAIDPSKRFESGDAVREALEMLIAPARIELQQSSLATPNRGLQPLPAEPRPAVGRDIHAAIDGRLRTESSGLRRSTSQVASKGAASLGCSPWPLPPATGRLLEAATDARDPGEFRHAAALWLARHVGAEAVLVAPLSGLARDAGLIGLRPEWLGCLIDGFARYRADFAQIVADSLRWRGFSRARDTDLEDWARRSGRAGFVEELAIPFGLVTGTAAVLVARGAQLGAVLLGRERTSRRFTDGECDLLNGVLPILAMGEAIHKPTPVATIAIDPSGAIYPPLTPHERHISCSAPEPRDRVPPGVPR
jgi:serine/threonine protein kinase